MNKVRIGLGAGLLAVVLFFFGIVAGPLLIIWSLNTLFPVLVIPYDIWSWLSVVILGTFLKTRLEYKRN